MTLLERLAMRDRQGGRLGRHSVMLASLVFMLVALPFLGWIPTRGLRFPILFFLVLLAAIFVNSTQRWMFWTAVAIGAASFAALSLAHGTGSFPARITGDLLGLALLVLTTFVMLNSLLRSRHVDADTIVGGICVYLLIGVCFSVVFRLLIDLDPDALVAGGAPIAAAHEDSSALPARLIYFSLVTLTTVGYGDIAPHDELAQMFAASEAAIGQLYLAIFIARLMGMYIAADRGRPGDDGSA